MKTSPADNRVLITGTAGFIGFHLAKLLLEEGFEIHGYDGFTAYYDVELKEARQKLLEEYPSFSSTRGQLESQEDLNLAADLFQPDILVHLAAQAGVRHSLIDPHSYISSNVLGTLNVLEVAKRCKVRHLLISSTSSVYGANADMPFVEIQKADMQLSLYAATKKANENMSHAYSHLWSIPTTVFRFFTVYGPWGRPDMALFKFVDAILDERPIDVYNYGKMHRDFTYIDDLVKGIKLLLQVIPEKAEESSITITADSVSTVAPWRVINIGNSEKVHLLDFIEAIEAEVGIKAEINYMPLQAGDVAATWADANLLKQLTGYTPTKNYRDGVSEFVRWFRSYYGR